MIWLPTVVTVAAAVALLLHGPILQFADYHAFADQRVLFSVPHACDVLSNAGFAVVGLWGLVVQRGRPRHALPPGNAGYLLFMSALVLTAAGSGYYHLAPGDARLVWDRLPIALGCAGLLAGVRAGHSAGSAREVLLLAGAAVASVLWWWLTNGSGLPAGASAIVGQGDLRPYLLLQALPIVLIPLWQAIHRAPRAERGAFAAAIGLYVVAKLAELYDRALFDFTGWISGHTIKHLLATAAAATIVWCVTRSRDRVALASTGRPRQYAPRPAGV